MQRLRVSARETHQIVVIPERLNAIASAAQFAVARGREPIGRLTALRQSNLVGLIIDEPGRSPGHAAPVEYGETRTLAGREAGDLSIVIGLADNKVGHVSEVIAG